MLSSFLQKLDFVHQFKMAEGSIGILGTKQVMLPSSLVSELNKESIYDIAKKSAHEEVEIYIKRINADQESTLNISEQIFDTYGLGKLKIELFDKKGKAIVHVSDAAFPGKSPLTRGVLAGMFSFLCKKNVDAEFKGMKGNANVYVIG